MFQSITARLLFGIILAAVPIIWVMRHRGARRLRHMEGKLDGMLLLVSVLCSLIVVVTTAVTIKRALSEQRFLDRTQPITATVDRCHVVESHTSGGVRSGPVYSLECTFRYLANGQQFVRELEAGYPSARDDYDAWRHTHPPGSPVVLRQALDNPTQVSGLTLLVPASTTAFASATEAMALGVGSLLLFLLSRLIVKIRSDRRESGR